MSSILIHTPDIKEGMALAHKIGEKTGFEVVQIQTTFDDKDCQSNTLYVAEIINSQIHKQKKLKYVISFYKDPFFSWFPDAIGIHKPTDDVLIQNDLIFSNKEFFSVNY